MSESPSWPLLTRITLIGLAVVFLQIGVVSGVPVLGVNVDLTPLLVAFIGLLCGSLVGAIAGFAIGLLIDLALLQTLGITSLIFTIIGYGAGRLREQRDPQVPMVALLVGTLASATSLIGYSVIEFLLGVDAPVSLELLRQIVFGVLVDAVVALPFWVLVRRLLRPSLPEDPRRRRRRTYATGGLSPLSSSRQRGGR